MKRPRNWKTGTRCAVCLHNDRARIEFLLAGGASCRAIGEQFELHKDAVWRHWRQHVTVEVKAGLIAGPVEIDKLASVARQEDRALLDYLGVLRSKLFHQFLRVNEANDVHGVTTVSGRLIEVLKELGRLTGEIRQISNGVTINNNIAILQSAAVTELQAVVIAALAVHPEARAAVIAALRQVETKYAARQSPTIEGSAVHAVAAA